MPKTRQTMTISLPEAMVLEVQRVSREENRTHSELVREALRRYFLARFPVVGPTKAELAGVTAGRAEIAKGEYMTVSELLHALDSSNRKAGRKNAAKSPRA